MKSKNPLTEQAFIYSLSDPRDGRIRYVGKTFDTSRRLREHLRCRGKARSVCWIKSLLRIGIFPKLSVIEIVESEIPEAWESRERFWISEFRRLGFDLVNLDDGGMGGRRMSDESKHKMSVAHRGVLKSPEWKAKIGMAHLGMKRPESARKNMRVPKKSPDFKEKCRNRNLGRKHSEKSRYNMWLSKQAFGPDINVAEEWEKHLAKPTQTKYQIKSKNHDDLWRSRVSAAITAYHAKKRMSTYRKLGYSIQMP